MLNELRAWCNKILPLAYSEALSYYEALNKTRKKVNEIIDYVNNIGDCVYTVNGKEPVEGNVDVGTVTSVNNTLPDENGNITIPTIGGVSSVNNKTGVVILDASDVGAMPDNYTPPVSSVNNKTGAVTLNASDVGAMPDNYTAPVSSVNNKTGAVTLNASDVGAMPDNYTAPVSSVNNKTGAVTLNASDVGALPTTTQYVSSINGQTGNVVVTTLESGTDGIWSYIKYGDGTYHAWYEGSINLLAGTAFAGGYFHQSSAALTPPSFSTAVTSLSGFPNGAMLMAYVGHAADYSTYWLNGVATAANGQPVRLDMYGTW